MAEDSNMLVDRVEAAIGHKLNEEDIYEVELWDKGRTLSPVVNTDAWLILVATIKRYADQAVASLLRMPPGDEHVPQAHAAAAALTDFYYKFQEDIQAAINAPMPSVLKHSIINSEVPPESL